nr:MAG TPA: hypothetical protein [Caudoviricetes sp.]
MEIVQFRWLFIYFINANRGPEMSYISSPLFTAKQVSHTLKYILI